MSVLSRSVLLISVITMFCCPSPAMSGDDVLLLLSGVWGARSIDPYPDPPVRGTGAMLAYPPGYESESRSVGSRCRTTRVDLPLASSNNDIFKGLNLFGNYYGIFDQGCANCCFVVSTIEAIYGAIKADPPASGIPNDFFGSIRWAYYYYRNTRSQLQETAQGEDQLPAPPAISILASRENTNVGGWVPYLLQQIAVSGLPGEEDCVSTPFPGDIIGQYWIWNYSESRYQPYWVPSPTGWNRVPSATNVYLKKSAGCTIEFNDIGQINPINDTRLYPSIEELKQVLADEKLIIIGAMITYWETGDSTNSQYFTATKTSPAFSASVAATGIMQTNYIPVSGDGHNMVIVDYDDGGFESVFGEGKVPAGLQSGAFLVRNSWGTDFGKAGYFFMPYSIISNYSGLEPDTAGPSWTNRFVHSFQWIESITCSEE